jgi:hypothetical protein
MITRFLMAILACAMSMHGASALAEQGPENEIASAEFTASKVHALLGVDPLGRVIIAIDADQDGRADQMLLFTHKVRLEGPWSKRLRDAHVEIGQTGVIITSRAESYALSLATSDAHTPRVPPWATNTFIRSGGIELARYWGWGDKGFSMAALDHGALGTWPWQFNDDLPRDVAVSR